LINLSDELFYVVTIITAAIQLVLVFKTYLFAM
jgi:hypothetical protein